MDPFDYVPIFTLDKDEYITFHQRMMIKVGQNNIKLDPALGIFINDIPVDGGGGVIIDEIVLTGMDRKIKMDVIDGLVFSLCPGGGAIDPCPDAVYNSFGNFGVKLDRASVLTIGSWVLDETLLGRLESYFATPNLVMPATAGVSIGGSVLGKSGIDYINITVPVELNNVNTRVDNQGNMITVLQGQYGGLSTRVTALEAWRSVAEGTLTSHTNRLATLETEVGGQDGRLDAVETSLGVVENTTVPALQTSVGSLDTRVTDLENGTSGVGPRVVILEGKVATLETSKADSTTVAALDTRVGSLETTVTTLVPRVDTLEVGVNDLVPRVENLETGFTAVEGDVVTLGAKVDGIDTRVATVESLAASNTTGLGALGVRVGSLETSLAGVSSVVTAQDTRLGAVESDVAILKVDVEGLGTAQVGIIADLTAHGVAIGNLEATTTDLDSRVVDLEVAVNGDGIDPTTGLTAKVGDLEGRVVVVESGLDTQDSRITALENAGGPDPVVLPHYVKGTLIDFGTGKTKLEEAKLTLGAATMVEADLTSTKDVSSRFDAFNPLAPTPTSFPLHLDTATGKIKYGVVSSTETQLPSYVKPTGLVFPLGSTFVEGSNRAADGTGNYFDVATGRVTIQSGAVNTVIDSAGFETLRRVAVAPISQPFANSRQFFTRSQTGSLQYVVCPTYLGSTNIIFAVPGLPGVFVTIDGASATKWNETSDMFSTFVEEPNPEPLKMVFYNPILKKMAWGDEPKPTSIVFGTTTLDVSGLFTEGVEGALRYRGDGITFTKKAASVIPSFTLGPAAMAGLNRLASRTTKGAYDSTVPFIGFNGTDYFNVPMPTYLRTNDIQFTGGNTFGVGGLVMGGFNLDGPSLGRTRVVEGMFNGFAEGTSGHPVVYDASTQKMSYSTKQLTLLGAANDGSSMTVSGDGFSLANGGTASQDNPAVMDFSRKKLADLDRFSTKTVGLAAPALQYSGMDPVTGVYSLVTANQLVEAGGGGNIPTYIKPTTIEMDNATSTMVMGPGSMVIDSVPTGAKVSIAPSGVTAQGATGAKIVQSSSSILASEATGSVSMMMTPHSLQAVNSAGRAVIVGHAHFDIMRGLNVATVAIDTDLPNLQALCFDKTSPAVPVYRKVNFNNTFAWLKPDMIESGRVMIDPVKMTITTNANNTSSFTSAGMTATSDLFTIGISPYNITMGSGSGTTDINYTQFTNLSRLSNNNSMNTVGRKYNIFREVTSASSPSHTYSSTLVTRAQEALEEARINLSQVDTLNNTLSFGGEAPRAGMLNTNGLYFPTTGNLIDSTVFCSTMARIGATASAHSILSKQVLQFNEGIKNVFELSKSGFTLTHSSGTGTTSFAVADIEKTKVVNAAFDSSGLATTITLNNTPTSSSCVLGPDGITFSYNIVTPGIAPIPKTLTIPSHVFTALIPRKYAAMNEGILGTNSSTPTTKVNFLVTASGTQFLKILPDAYRSSVTLDFLSPPLSVNTGTISSTVYNPSVITVGFIVVDSEKPQYTVSITQSENSVSNTFVCTGIEAYRGLLPVFITPGVSFTASQYWIVTAKVINFEGRSPAQSITFNGKIKFEYRGPDL